MWIVLGGVAAALFVAILYLNGGRFIYTLDDPYIHLAMSDGIFRGGYGVNPGEFAAASSSVLYPFLLAWAAPFEFHEYVPLVIGIAAFGATIQVIRRTLLRIGFEGVAGGQTAALVLTGLIVWSYNVVGVVFSGMEHSLQVLLACAAVYGTIVFVREGRCPWWLVLAIVVGPLVRYENLAPSFGALGVLLLGGAVRPALLAGGLCFTSLGLFSLFLYMNGLGVLPSSVLAKSAVAVASTGGVVYDFIYSVAAHVVHTTLSSYQGVMLSGLWLLAAVRLIHMGQSGPKRDERLVALFVVVAAGLHILFGEYGWFGRYEVYALCIATLGCLYVYRRPVLSMMARLRPARFAALSTVVLLVLGLNLWTETVRVPVAANNIYEQQYQMHRLVTQYLQMPVAANDIGWLTYRNARYVLDLWGLGSRETLIARRAGWAADDIEAIVARHGIEVVMIYDKWFGRRTPGSWRRIASLDISRENVSAAEPNVSVYVTEQANEAAIREKLARFARDLPNGPRLRFDNAAPG